MSSTTGWDLIVVGAGSSGAALAARSALKGKRVLLLEAGPDARSANLPESMRSANPGRALRLEPEILEPFVWGDLQATRSAQQDPAPYWRGKGLGGSSLVNGQIAIRPPLEDFDEWSADGCTGWSSSDVLPYFSRLEADAQFGAKEYHGADGPIPIYRAPESTWGAVDRAFVDAVRARGVIWHDDMNAPGATGVSVYPINSRDLKRVTVNDGYLEPLRGDPRLSIVTGALVDHVLFDSDRAIGVRAMVDGVRSDFHADEVVLSAGAVHSPGILVRSGIGPADVLGRLGLPVRADLPAGRGLQDHAAMSILLELNDDASTADLDHRHTNIARRYSSGLAEGGANDMMMVALNRSVMIMKDAIVSHGIGASSVFVNRMFSRGKVEVTSLDPRSQPRIAENMLSDPRDLERLMAGVRELAEITLSAPYSAILRRSPALTNPELFSALDDYAALATVVRNTVADTQHATSTCRMGSPEAATSVVDAECRVIGTDALRVVDASIFPFVPRANTHLTCVMVGELMADRLGA